MTLAYIPSPTTAVWDIGPIPVRAYALFIVLGIVIACAVTEARLRARGVQRYAVLDLAVWAVPFGIVGARLYHVITSPDQFFGENGNLADIVRIWHGGLGIWGAIAGGAVGVWFACRQLKLPFRVVADAAAVGIPLAQAVGRLGNWFNNELYGSRTTLPWGLQVHPMRDGRALVDPVTGEPTAFEGLYHPTFLYEALWCVGVALLVLFVGRQLRLGRGRQFALYVVGYTAGRTWIETLRIDGTDAVPIPDAQQTIFILGQRINVWVSLLVLLAALAYLVWRRGPQEYLLAERDGDGEVTGYRVVTEAEFRAAGGGEAGAPAGTGAAGPAGAEATADAPPSGSGGDGSDPVGGSDRPTDPGPADQSPADQAGAADDGAAGDDAPPPEQAATSRSGDSASRDEH